MNKAMHSRLIQRFVTITFIAFVVTLLSGCVCVPVPTNLVVKYGKEINAKNVEFLRQPGATVDVVVSRLGTPTWMSSDRRAIAYSWATELEWKVVGVTLYGPGVGPTLEMDARERALFIAFDQNGYITNHTLRSISGKTEGEALEAGYRKWIQSQPVRR